MEDEKEYAGISVEEYNLIKPPKQQKSSSTVMRLKDYIRANGKKIKTHFDQWTYT